MAMNQEDINHSKIKRASIFAITVSIVLCVLKFYVYKTTNSCSLHASAMDSLMDTAISLINLFAVYMLSIKKSNLAPSGWDKISVFVTTLQCLIISFLSFEIMHESFERLYNNEHHIHNFENILIVSAISFFISLALILYQKKVVKETNSLIIKADMIHFISDLYSNIFMFIGFIFIKLFNVTWIDAILGMIVSFYLISSVVRLLKISIYSLLDLNFREEKKKVFAILKKHNYSFKEEDLQVLFSGAKFIINLNLSKDLISESDAIKKILSNLSVTDHDDDEKKCSSHKCNHVSEGLKATKAVQINIILS